MKILIVTTACSEKKYAEICKKRKRAHLDPPQKFFKLLIDGLAAHPCDDIECISSLPISSTNFENGNFTGEIERVCDNLTYHYLPFNSGFKRYFSIYRNTKSAVEEWCIKNRNEKKVIICDGLWYYSAVAAQKIAKKHGVKIIAVVTDLPLLATKMKAAEGNLIKRGMTRAIQYLTHRSLKKYDAYVPLTESIDEAVNPKKKPSIIIEGFADSTSSLQSIPNKKRIVLYAGGICEKYGIKALVEAFILADDKDAELHLYGAGSYVDDVVRISHEHANIHYMGCVTLEEIVEREREALVLVNPRPTDEEFSKFSFPSKTMEYMTTGTPLLTTKLPGIPKAYFDHCYTFKTEDVESMSKQIKEVLGLDQKQLDEMGKSAYEFVINNKSNVKQASRLINFIETEIC